MAKSHSLLVTINLKWLIYYEHIVRSHHWKAMDLDELKVEVSIPSFMKGFQVDISFR